MINYVQMSCGWLHTNPVPLVSLLGPVPLPGGGNTIPENYRKKIPTPLLPLRYTPCPFARGDHV